MNLFDTELEERFRSDLRDWLRENAHLAPRIDAEPNADQLAAWRTWSRHLHDAGYVGITWPADYGGRGLAPVFQALWLEEHVRARVPDHVGLIGLGMAGPTIIAWGTDEQRRRYLPPLLRADEIWCQGFSEPDSGSDLANVRTSAVLDGDEWVVNGQKVWSSFAHFADRCILLVRTDPDAPKHAGLSYLLLDMHAPGVTVRPLRQLTGDPEFNEIFLDDVRVPRDSILGAPGDGWKVAMTTLSHERGTHGVGLAATLSAEFHAAAARLSVRLDDPALRDRLGELWIEAEALRVTNLRSLSALERTGVPGPESTISKLHWSHVNQRLTALMADALGPAALQTGSQAVDGGHWAYARLRARGNTIEAGTTEVLRNIIAERVLGLPRSR